MAGQADGQPKEADLRSLSEKLAAFTETLTPRERAILMTVVQSAIVRDADVQGYGWWDSASSADWFDALSRAMVWVVVGQGLIVDKQVMEYLHPVAGDQRAAETTPVREVAAPPPSAPKPAGAS